MRTRLHRLGLAAVVPLVIAPLMNLPAARADEDAGVGYWRNMQSEFAKRQKPGAALGVLEDDKTIDPDKTGGTVSFNPNNMETKCTAVRGDGDAPRSAGGSANYIQPYKWSPGLNEGGPPTDYFKIDKTKGGECEASPVIDPNGVGYGPGLASATSSGTADADNSSVANSHKADETPEIDKIVPVVYNSYNEVEQPVATSASASAGTLVMLQPVGPGQSGPPTPTYLSKACSAEGRAYWKFTRGLPCNPNP